MGCSPWRGKGTQPDVFTLLPAAPWAEGGPGGRAGACADAVCQVAGSPGNPALSFPAIWVGAGQQMQMCRPSGRAGLILRQVRQGCFSEVVFLAWHWISSPTLSCLVGPLRWPGWAGGSAQDSVRANDKCNSV